MLAALRALSIAAVAALSLAACQADGGPATPPPPAGHGPSGAGRMCGGIAGFQCGAGLYCAMPPEMQGVPDGAGTCRARPQVCTREYRPVCGADGRTYGNACEAAAAGVSVAAEGACGK